MNPVVRVRIPDPEWESGFLVLSQTLLTTRAVISTANHVILPMSIAFLSGCSRKFWFSPTWPAHSCTTWFELLF